MRRSLFPELEYTFKHVLTHEVAYGSLLQERRRVLHARIVEAIERLDADRLAEHVEQLAHHALRGEVWDKALAYRPAGGGKGHGALGPPRGRGVLASRRSVALSHLPETRDTREQAIDLRLALRTALSPLGDYGRMLASSARGRDPRQGPRRSASAGPGLGLSVSPLLLQWVRMARPSPWPSVPWHSPRPAETFVLQAMANNSLGL